MKNSNLDISSTLRPQILSVKFSNWNINEVHKSNGDFVTKSDTSKRLSAGNKLQMHFHPISYGNYPLEVKLSLSIMQFPNDITKW